MKAKSNNNITAGCTVNFTEEDGSVSTGQVINLGATESDVDFDGEVYVIANADLTKVKIRRVKPVAEKNGHKQYHVAAGHRSMQNRKGETPAACWVRVFQENEKRAAKQKWTDERISQYMHSQFPESTAKNFDQVSIVRSMYNMGRYTGGKKPAKSTRAK